MFDTLAVANYLVAQLKTIDKLGNNVQLGAPLSIGKTVAAYVTAGGQRTTIKSQGVLKREAHYFIDFTYRLDGGEAAAEAALMQIIDALLVLIWADPTLGGTSNEVAIETGLADQPDYRERAGKEFREFPVLVTACQYATYETQPHP